MGKEYAVTGLFEAFVKVLPRRLLGLARPPLALPGWSLAAALLLASAPGHAAEPNCKSKSLIPALRADGKLDAVEASAAMVANGEGRFWRIDKDGAPPSYLLGTMHLMDPRLLRLPAPVETAFDASARLVIETTDVLDRIKLSAAIFADPALTTLPDGKTLNDFLDPAEKSVLERILSAKGVPFQAVEKLQPWFLSTGFMLPDCMAKSAMGNPIVLDISLAERAKAAGKPVDGLETAIEQLKAMAAIPIEEQMDGFVAVLTAEDQLADIFETMLQLYLGEHVSTIMPAIEAAVPEGSMLVGAGSGYGSFEQKVIIERNLRMADRLEPFLKTGGSFVAVGALHLPGEKGLVALLREHGYAVSRVRVPVADPASHSPLGVADDKAAANPASGSGDTKK